MLRLFPNACQDANRDSRTSSSTCCVAAAEEACKAQSSRPFVLGDPFPFLEAMELDAGHRQTGNSDCLAPAGLQVLLALEE
jgi:hypothetical protein